MKNIVLLNTLVYPETSWAVKLFLLALRTPGIRDFLASPKGLVGAMQFGVVHKDRLNREVLAPYTTPLHPTQQPPPPLPRSQVRPPSPPHPPS